MAERIVGCAVGGNGLQDLLDDLGSLGLVGVMTPLDVSIVTVPGPAQATASVGDVIRADRYDVARGGNHNCPNLARQVTRSECTCEGQEHCVLVGLWSFMWIAEDQAQEALDAICVTQPEKYIGKLERVTGSLAIVAFILIPLHHTLDLVALATLAILQEVDAFRALGHDADQEEAGTVDPAQRQHLSWMLQRSDDVGVVDERFLAPVIVDRALRVYRTRGSERKNVAAASAASGVAGVHQPVEAEIFGRATRKCQVIAVALESRGELAEPNHAVVPPARIGLQTDCQRFDEPVEVGSDRRDQSEHQLRSDVGPDLGHVAILE